MADHDHDENTADELFLRQWAELSDAERAEPGAARLLRWRIGIRLTMDTIGAVGIQAELERMERQANVAIILLDYGDDHPGLSTAALYPFASERDRAEIDKLLDGSTIEELFRD